MKYFILFLIILTNNFLYAEFESNIDSEAFSYRIETNIFRYDIYENYDNLLNYNYESLEHSQYSIKEYLEENNLNLYLENDFYFFELTQQYSDDKYFIYESKKSRNLHLKCDVNENSNNHIWGNKFQCAFNEDYYNKYNIKKNGNKNINDYKEEDLKYYLKNFIIENIIDNWNLYEDSTIKNYNVSLLEEIKLEDTYDIEAGSSHNPFLRYFENYKYIYNLTVERNENNYEFNINIEFNLTLDSNKNYFRIRKVKNKIDTPFSWNNKILYLEALCEQFSYETDSNHLVDIDNSYIQNEKPFCKFNTSKSFGLNQPYLLSIKDIYPEISVYNENLNKKIDIVVVYNKNEINIRNIIDHHEKINEEIFKNSNLNGYEINFIDFLPVEIKDKHFEEDLNDIISNINQQREDFFYVNNYLEKLNADIYVYIIDKKFMEDDLIGKSLSPDYSKNGNTYEGNYILNSINKEQDYGFILKNNLNINERPTSFSHEFGHILGLSHDGYTLRKQIEGLYSDKFSPDYLNALSKVEYNLKNKGNYNGAFYFSNPRTLEPSFLTEDYINPYDPGKTTVMGYPLLLGSIGQIGDTLNSYNLVFSNSTLSGCGKYYHFMEKDHCGVSKKNKDREAQAESVDTIRVTYPIIANIRDRKEGDPVITASTFKNDTILGTPFDDDFSISAGMDQYISSLGNDELTLNTNSSFTVEEYLTETTIKGFSKKNQIKFETKHLQSSYNISQAGNDVLIEITNIKHDINNHNLIGTGRIIVKDIDMNNLFEKEINGIKTLTLKTNEFVAVNVSSGRYTGNEDQEEIFGSTSRDTVDSGAGYDIIYGYEGNDILGNRYTNSEEWLGNEIVDYTKSYGNDYIGGLGNDLIYGTRYGDTYYFNLGDGKDIIYEKSTETLEYGNNTDRLVLGYDVKEEEINLFFNGDSLIIRFQMNENDEIILDNFLLNESNQIEEFYFENNQVIWNHDKTIQEAANGSDSSCRNLPPNWWLGLTDECAHNYHEVLLLHGEEYTINSVYSHGNGYLTYICEYGYLKIIDEHCGETIILTTQ